MMIMMMMAMLLATMSEIEYDNGGDDDDVDDDDDDDDDVQRFSSPNSCDPVRLKCQTPTNRPFLQDSFKWDHRHHHHPC